MGMSAFKYAWITDITQEERVKGMTVDIFEKSIKLDDLNIIFVDTPGHNNYILQAM